MRLTLALALGSLPRAALAAEEAEPNRERPPAHDHDEPLPPGNAPRPRPDYAEPAAATAGDALLWVPRVVLFPLYVVTEYGLRRPAGAIYVWAERNRIRERYYEFFTLDEEKKIQLLPTGTVDLGLRPTVGAYFSWPNAIGESDLRLRVTTGGLDLWTVNTLLHTPLQGRDYLRTSADYARRPDSTFYGLGRDIREVGAHYLNERFVGRSGLTHQSGKFAFTAAGGVVAARFDPAPDGVNADSLATAIAAGRFEAPPALVDGVLAAFAGIAARYDTRPPRRPPLADLSDLAPPRRTGVVLGAHGTQFTGLKGTRSKVEDSPRLPHWLRYGGVIGYSLDVSGTQRTLQLDAQYAAVEPLPTDNPVPFSEQISLGGSYPMRAFTGGRLIDESALVSTLSYNWPLLPNLDGSLHYSVGNVFARHVRDFEWGRLRSSFGIGMETVSSLDHPFEILLALGTKPFEEGGDVDAVRFVFGTSAGF